MLIRKIIRSALCLLTVILVSGLWNGLAAAETRIAVLLSSQQPPFEEALKGFQQFLGRQNVAVVYDVYPPEDMEDRAGQAIQKIKTQNPALILAIGSLATESALQEIHNIPVISCMILRQDQIKNSTNATGVFLEFSVKTQFEWLRRFLPKVRNIGVIYNAEGNHSKIEEAKEVAEKMGLRIVAQQIDSSQNLPDALKTLANRADVLWGITDDLVLNPQTAKHILLFSFRNRIPFVGLSSSWVKAGALYSLDWDCEDIGAQCGDMALKVLQGAAVGSIPPAPPRHVRYSLNQKTASHMKIEIQEALVKGALSVF